MAVKFRGAQGAARDQWWLSERNAQRCLKLLDSVPDIKASGAPKPKRLPKAPAELPGKGEFVRFLSLDSAETGRVAEVTTEDGRDVRKTLGKGMALKVYVHDDADSLKGMVAEYWKELDALGMNVAASPKCGMRVTWEPEGAETDGFVVASIQESIKGPTAEQLLACVVGRERTDDRMHANLKKIVHGLLDSVRILHEKTGRSVREEPGKPWNVAPCFDHKPSNHVLTGHNLAGFFHYIDLFLPLGRHGRGSLKLFDVVGSGRMVEYDRGFTTYGYRLGTTPGLITKTALESMSALALNDNFLARMSEDSALGNTRKLVQGIIIDYVKENFGDKALTLEVARIMASDYYDYVVRANDGEDARFGRLPFKFEVEFGIYSNFLKGAGNFDPRPWFPHTVNPKDEASVLDDAREGEHFTSFDDTPETKKF